MKRRGKRRNMKREFRCQQLNEGWRETTWWKWRRHGKNEQCKNVTLNGSRLSANIAAHIINMSSCYRDFPKWNLPKNFSDIKAISSCLDNRAFRSTLTHLALSSSYAHTCVDDDDNTSRYFDCIKVEIVKFAYVRRWNLSRN